MRQERRANEANLLLTDLVIRSSGEPCVDHSLATLLVERSSTKTENRTSFLEPTKNLEKREKENYDLFSGIMR